MIIQKPQWAGKTLPITGRENLQYTIKVFTAQFLTISLFLYAKYDNSFV